MPTTPHQDMRETIGKLIGTVTMSWKPRPSGVFQSDVAVGIIDQIMSLITSQIERARAKEKERTLKILTEEIALTQTGDSGGITSRLTSAYNKVLNT